MIRLAPAFTLSRTSAVSIRCAGANYAIRMMSTAFPGPKVSSEDFDNIEGIVIRQLSVHVSRHVVAFELPMASFFRQVLTLCFFS